MKLLLPTLLLFLSGAVFGQDLISTSSGEEIKATVISLTDSTISYKKFGSEGPLYTKSLRLIYKVKYQNGDIEEYNKSTVPLADVLEMSKNSPKDLLKKGNNVFVEIPNEASRAGERYFHLGLKDWKYWNLVSSPNEAHFIIEFNIDKKAIGDKTSWLVFKTREGKEFLHSPTYRVSTNAFNGYNAFKGAAEKVIDKYLKSEFKN